MTTDDKQVAGAVVDAPQAAPTAEAQGCEPGKPIVTEGQAIPAKKVPVPLKVFGILMIIWGAVEILKLLAVVLAIILAFVFNVDITQYTGGTSLQKPVLVLLICLAASSGLIAGFDIALGVLLLVNPFDAMVSVVMLCGILLILEGAINLGCTLYAAMELRTLERMANAAANAALSALADAADEADPLSDNDGVVYDAESTDVTDKE